MDKGAVCLLFWGLAASQTGGLKVISRGINGLLPPVYENVEYKGQQILRICAFFERGNIVRLYFVACHFPVVESKLPAKNVAA